MVRGSNSSKYLIEAHRRGYRVIDGRVYNPSGCEITTRRESGKKSGYFSFSARLYHRRVKENSVHILVHQLVAYQLYGDRLFDDGVVVRHRDGNSENNLEDNILIGTQKENSMDRPREQRVASATFAASKRRAFSDEEMRKIREFYRNESKLFGRTSYKRTMEAFGISSKGTLHRILAVEYKTEAANG